MFALPQKAQVDNNAHEHYSHRAADVKSVDFGFLDGPDVERAAVLNTAALK